MHAQYYWIECEKLKQFSCHKKNIRGKWHLPLGIFCIFLTTFPSVSRFLSNFWKATLTEQTMTLSHIEGNWILDIVEEKWLYPLYNNNNGYTGVKETLWIKSEKLAAGFSERLVWLSEVGKEMLVEIQRCVYILFIL